MFFILIFIDINQVSNILQKLYKNHMTNDKRFDVLYVIGIKYRVTYRQNCLIL